MQLVDQHAKAIMEGCKERARAAGLRVVAEASQRSLAGLLAALEENL
mgnify:CR=1 FL=1